MAVEGVDYAWSRPVISQLAALGKRFACRYGGPGSSGKQLDPAEALALSAAGLEIVANAEGAADGLLGGWSAGESWARDADAHFRACGMPPGRPIYLSVDFDVQSGQWAAVASALRGAASALGGVHRVGVYGGRRAIEWARRDGVANWFWQTYAWSSGVWVPGNNIEQYRNGVVLAGGTLDLDRALSSDFGQWTTGDDMTPTESAQLANANALAWASVTGADALVYPNNNPGATPVNVGNPLWALLRAIAARVDLDPAELEQVKAAAEAGARAGSGLTPEQAQAASERAVRKVLGELDE